MTMELYYTAFLFGTVSLHGAYIKESIVHYGFLWLMAFSILNHAKWNDTYKGKALVDVGDKTLTYFLVSYDLIRALDVSIRYNTVIPFTIAASAVGYIVYVYHVAKLSWLAGDAWKNWHATIHISAWAANHTVMFMMQYLRAAT